MGVEMNGGDGIRQRFRVEIKGGETTIVSYKKLLREAAAAATVRANAPPGGTTAEVPPVTHSNNPITTPLPLLNFSREAARANLLAGGSDVAAQQLPVNDSYLITALPLNGQPAENELKDGHPSRFGAVIEKIERLYMGKHSSDEEDLNGVPDDDEYDTKDSFIDDAELDDYFQVDNSAIKHDGFFVNRGQLERINEPTSLPSQQPKKRQRKDLEKNGDDGELPNKLVKMGNKATQKSKKSRNVALPHVVALPSVHNEDMKFENQPSPSVVCAKKKSAETKISLDPSISSSLSNSGSALPKMGNVDQRNLEIRPKNQGNKLKDGAKSPNATMLKSREENVSAQKKSELAILPNSNRELDQLAQRREKDGNHERPNPNVSAGKVSMSNKCAVVQRKEGSGIKPKGTILEKTIGELETMVAECRPPSTEVQDADMASQAAGKKRLPREVKLKLAKVARLAQASHGRIPDELVKRLMSILGHLVQVRTLKRNLNDMVTVGLTAKKEKDARVEHMKKEVAELIRTCLPYIKSKVVEQQAGGSDGFQEMGNEEKKFIKRKYAMDDALEDKICDLYDVFVDGLDEDAGSQARKLYAELCQLWPEGFMDKHGIKRAVCKAKDRKRALYAQSQEQEKNKRKKLVPKTTEGTVQFDTSSVAQPQHTQEKPVTDSFTHGSSSTNKAVSNKTSAILSVWAAKSSPNSSNLDHQKQDKMKVKGSSVNPIEKVPMDAVAKKTVKRKPETDLEGGQSRLEKPVSASGDEKAKIQKKAVEPSKIQKKAVEPPKIQTKAVEPPKIHKKVVEPPKIQKKVVEPLKKSSVPSSVAVVSGTNKEVSPSTKVNNSAEMR